MKSCIGVKMTGKTGTSDQMKTLRENRRLLAKMPKQSFEEDCHPVPTYGGKYGFVSPPSDGRAHKIGNYPDQAAATPPTAGRTLKIRSSATTMARHTR